MQSFFFLLLVVVGASYMADAAITCDRNFIKIGCFKRQASILTELILTDRDASHAKFSKSLIDWEDFSASTHSLACRCLQKAQEHYRFFAIGFYGECWAGNDMNAYSNMLKSPSSRSVDCVNGNYKSCSDGAETECAGKAHAEYIYTINPKAPEPIDGGYSDWSDYNPCSASCGDGYQVRERTCSNPVPNEVGKGCGKLGETTQKRTCKVKECPIDGGFSDWSEYNKCSKSCGGGFKTKTRSCTNPSPAHGGLPCDGAISETAACNTQGCPVNGKWSSWSTYGSCSRTCDSGTHTRTRKCNNPAPAHGGNSCSGQSSQTSSCNTQGCPKRYSEYHEGKTCEGGKGTLTCPPNWVIKLSYYNYGRTERDPCSKAVLKLFYLTNCESGNNHRIYNACQNKRTCSVWATNDWFGGNPCWGTPKYLHVKFRCYGYNKN